MECTPESGNCHSVCTLCNPGRCESIGKVYFMCWGRIQRIHGVWDPMPELTITSPHVHSRVDSKTFTMGNLMPESTLNTMPQSNLLKRTYLYRSQYNLHLQQRVEIDHCRGRNCFIYNIRLWRIKLHYFWNVWKFSFFKLIYLNDANSAKMSPN